MSGEFTEAHWWFLISPTIETLQKFVHDVLEKYFIDTINLFIHLATTNEWKIDFKITDISLIAQQDSYWDCGGADFSWNVIFSRMQCSGRVIGSWCHRAHCTRQWKSKTFPTCVQSIHWRRRGWRALLAGFVRFCVIYHRNPTSLMVATRDRLPISQIEWMWSARRTLHCSVMYSSYQHCLTANWCRNAPGRGMSSLTPMLRRH